MAQPTTADRSTRGPQRTPVPQWARNTMIALATALVAVVVVVLVFANHSSTQAGPGTPLPPAPTAVATPSAPSEVTSSAPTSQAPTSPAQTSASTTTASQLVDGCLGGVGALDRAVLVAQQTAPITPAGAAEFTATLMRWAQDVPATSGQATTATTILTSDATEAARKTLSSNLTTTGYMYSLDFSQGKYIVNSFTSGSAVVSWSAGVSPIHNGVAQGSATLAGTVVLAASDGKWFYRDSPTAAAGLLQTITTTGAAFDGGC